MVLNDGLGFMVGTRMVGNGCCFGVLIYICVHIRALTPAGVSQLVVHYQTLSQSQHHLWLILNHVGVVSSTLLMRLITNTLSSMVDLFDYCHTSTP